MGGKKHVTCFSELCLSAFHGAGEIRSPAGPPFLSLSSVLGFTPPYQQVSACAVPHLSRKRHMAFLPGVPALSPGSVERKAAGAISVWL